MMGDDRTGAVHRFIREPVVHFALIGVAIFALDRAMQPDEAPNEIIVGERTVERLRSEYENRHGSLPDEARTRALVDAHVRDEVLYREALDLGLHRSDPIVRRRMIQAMEFLSEDLAPVPAPTDEQLRSYLDAHPESFERPARVSFQHLFFSDGTSAESRAQAARAQLREGGDASKMGDAFAHGSTIQHASREALVGKFGDAFAERAMELDKGRWSEPVGSTYGLHLVFIESSKPAGQPSLDEVRHQVEVAWRQDARERANREATQRLREGYDVRVEWGDATP